jgi:hypothetical protein
MALSGSLNFLTASSYGAGGNTVLTLDGNNTDSKASFTAIDFAGLNTIIREPMTASQNYLGQPMDVPMLGDLSFTSPPLRETGNDLGNPGNYISLFRLQNKPPGVAYADPTIFNALMLHRNGPYQHPSWKQYRGGEHPVARTLRLNNTMSIDSTFADPVEREKHKKRLRERLENDTHSEIKEYLSSVNTSIQQGASPKLHRQPTLAQYYEPSVLKAHKPFLYNVSNIKIRSTLMNQMVFFQNRELNQALNIAGTDRYTASFYGESTKRPKQEYYNFIEIAKENGATGFIYSETIFPKPINAFRPYKLEKTKYEEVSGLGSNGYDRAVNRSFWRNLQPGLGTMISSDGTSRIRTDGAEEIDPDEALYAGNTTGLGARNSQEAEQFTPLPVQKDLIGTYQLIDGDFASRGGGWNFTYKFMEPGIIVHSGHDTTTGSWIVAYEVPALAPYANFATLESYQPYPISLLSMWPLDPRPDMYDDSKYLTSSHGGKGAQIGLTPHRMKEYTSHDTYQQTDSSVFTSSAPEASGDSVFFVTGGFELAAGGTDVSVVSWPNGNYNTYQVRNNATASYGQMQNLLTGTAGELVYSTKTTMFFHATGSEDNDIKGYKTVTPSMQFNRHTFPYNTPFYATNKIRGRDPFYNSYSDFAQDMKHFGRDYSIVPEYKISNNLQFYFEQYLKPHIEKELFTEVKLNQIANAEYSGPGDPADSFYDLAASEGDIGAGPTDRLIIRKVHFPINKKPKDFKLNFLTLDGAFITASADAETLRDSTESTLAYKYAHLTKTTSESTLKKELGFSNEKTDVSYLQNSSSVIFDQAFSRANTGELSNILAEPLNNGKDTIPKTIKFSAHGLKKLRPEKNFYPVTKTVDIGNKFRNFIYESLHKFKSIPEHGEGQLYDKTDLSCVGKICAVSAEEAGALQTFLEPFFAPGILFNSLKSGIAVDYPVYTSKPAYFAPCTFFSGSYTSSGSSPIKDATKYGPANTGDRFTDKITQSFNYGGFYAVGASRCIPSILTSAPDFRMPFEAIYDTSIIKTKFNSSDSDEGSFLYLTTDFLDLDINYPEQSAIIKSANDHDGNIVEHPGAAFTRTGPRATLDIKNDNTTEKFLYESSINNFLCETMNFFLEDQDLSPGQKLPVFVSDYREDSEINLDADKAYALEVKLKMGADQVMTEGPRVAGIGGTSPDPLPGRAGYIPRFGLDLARKMRGYLYGPPVEVVRMSGSVSVLAQDVYDEATDTAHKIEPFISSDIDNDGIYTNNADYEAYFAANLTDPAYQTYTPPYFYGPSKMVVQAISGSSIEKWNDLFFSTDSNSYYVDSYVSSSTETPSKRIKKDLVNHLPGAGSTSGFSSTRMKIDSSIDIFNKADITYVHPDQEVRASLIYMNPKWVCPVLDFSSSYAAVSSQTLQGINKEKKEEISFVNNNYHDFKTGRGLWGGYGSDPYDQLTQNKIQNLTGDSNLQKGLLFSVSDISKIASKTQADYRTNIGNPTSGYFVDKQTSAASNTTGSLLQKLGLAPGLKEIGKIAETKKISEALVVIPYFEKPVILRGNNKMPSGELFVTREIIPGKHFLPIHNMLFENLLSMALAKRKFDLSDLLPDFDNGGRRRRISFGFESEESYEEAANTDVFKMIETILGDEENGIPGYELPPELDFIHYRQSFMGQKAGEEGPFQMIVIPFEHELTKQELIDIYQGIMPDSSLSFEKAISSVTLSLSPNQRRPWIPKTKGGPAFFGIDEGLSLSSINPANFLDPSYLYSTELKKYVLEADLSSQWIKSSRDFYKNLKFMTFKIKQRAIKDYTNYKNRQIEKAVLQRVGGRLIGATKDDVNLGFDTSLKVRDRLGYNWPYDDFSLMEAFKLDIRVEIED